MFFGATRGGIVASSMAESGPFASAVRGAIVGAHSHGCIDFDAESEASVSVPATEHAFDVWAHSVFACCPVVHFVAVALDVAVGLDEHECFPRVDHMRCSAEPLCEIMEVSRSNHFEVRDRECLDHGSQRDKSGTLAASTAGGLVVCVPNAGVSVSTTDGKTSGHGAHVEKAGATTVW